jgi:hypothetical protein
MEVLILPDNYVFFPITGNKEALAQHIQTHGQDLYRSFDKSVYGRAAKDGWSTIQDPYQALIDRHTKNKKTANKPVVMPEPLEEFRLASCAPVLLGFLTDKPEEEENQVVEQEQERPKRARFEFETIEDLSNFVFNPQFPQLLKDSQNLV